MVVYQVFVIIILLSVKCCVFQGCGDRLVGGRADKFLCWVRCLLRCGVHGPRSQHTHRSDVVARYAIVICFGPFLHNNYLFA